MAQEKDKAQAERVKSKFSLKTMLILSGVMLIEALAFLGAFMLAGGPADVKAEIGAEARLEESELPVEKLVVADRFQNTRQGKAYLYETEIYIVIRKKHEAQIDGQLDTKAAQISTDIATVFRRAEPAHLLEPTLATLTRQIRAALEERFELDEDGKSMIEQVLIRKCTRYAADL